MSVTSATARASSGSQMPPTSHRGQAVQRVPNRHHAAKISSHHGALAQEWRPGDPAARPLGPTLGGFGPFGRTPAGTPGGASAKRCPPTSGHDDQRRLHLDRHSVYAIGLGDNRKPTLCTAVAAPILLMVRAWRVLPTTSTISISRQHQIYQ